MVYRQPRSMVEVTATVGNGHLLAGFDNAGILRTLTGPHLDHPQHLHSSSLRLDVTGSNGMPRRLDGLGWRHEQDYLPGTDILRTRSTAPNGLKIEQRAVAMGDALVIGIQLCRGGRSPAGVALVWELGLQVGGRLHANALRYLPDSDALVAYQREYAIAVGSTPALDRVVSKDRGLGGTNGSRQGGAPLTAIGQVSAEIRLRLQRSRPTLLLVVLGQPFESLPKMVELRRDLEGSQEWPAELAPMPVRTREAAKGLSIPDLGTAQADAAECYRRSVLSIRQLVDRSGAILAGPPIDEGFLKSGGYAFCWPRDGAFIAQGLDVAGDEQAASHFFRWVLSVQPEDGIWKQRYYADGMEAPCWATHQLDETGTLLWALDRHLHTAFDAKLMANGLVAAVRAYRSVTSLASEDGWPPSTQNLWEDHEGKHLYTLAALLAGARAWNQRARASREGGAAAELAHAESQLERALAEWPLQAKSGVMARAIVGSPRGIKPDFTPDASLLGLSVPFGTLDLTDGRLAATISAIETELVTSTGRVRRYVGDTYRGGNAWPLLGLWLAWHKLRVGDRSAALRLYRRVLADRTPAGLLAEQVDSRTGQALWVVPLAWAHAWFLVVSHELAKLDDQREWRSKER